MFSIAAAGHGEWVNGLVSASEARKAPSLLVFAVDRAVGATLHGGFFHFGIPLCGRAIRFHAL